MPWLYFAGGVIVGWRLSVAIGAYRNMSRSTVIKPSACVFVAVLAFFAIPVGINVQ